MRKPALWLFTCWVGGCASEPAAPPPPAPEAGPPPPAGIVYAPEFEPAPEPELCPVLAALISRETDGFAGLRGRELASEEWLAAATVPGTERCTIEGDAYPRARFACATGPLPGSGQAAQIEFETLAEKIDHCLQRPSWFPRDWRKGQLFQFAMGERLQAWTDHSTWPPSAVVLKVQQDLASRDYRVHLNLETMR